MPLKSEVTADGEFVFKPENSIGFLIRDTHRAFSKVLGAAIADADVTVGMWFFLRALWEEDGLTQRELSRRIGMTEPTTVSAIDTMEKRGFVERRVDPEDRRRRMVCLTGRGRALKAELLPRAFEVNMAAIEALTTEEVETLRDLMSRIKANLKEQAGGG